MLLIYERDRLILNSDNPPGPTAAESIITSAPSPVVTSSNVELVKLLKDWIDSHPDLRIPELARYDRNSLENNFAIEASLVETGERVWIIRLGVIDMYQGWVLEKSDGSKILVKSHYRKGGHVYYGWLGGEMGYSDEIIAHHKDVPRLVLTLRLYARRQSLDAEDVLNEYDVSKDALEPAKLTPMPTTPGGGNSIMDSQGSDTALSSPPSDSDEPLVISRASRKRSSRKENASNSKKAKMSASSATKPKGANGLLSIDDAEVRVKVKKLHKIFPKVTIAVCECVLLKNQGNVDNAIDDLYDLQNIPTSTDTTVFDDGPPAQAARSHRAKLTGQLRTPSPARRKSSHTTQLATPFSTAQSPSSFGYPTPQTPSLRAPRNPITTINFFLSNPTMGAVPIPFATIKSKNKFFTEAISAHFLTSASISHDDNESVVAASVAMPGLTHPIVVRRKNGNPAWEEVGRVVREVEGLRGGVEVEVRCVLQPVGPVPRKGRSYGR